MSTTTEVELEYFRWFTIGSILAKEVIPAIGLTLIPMIVFSGNSTLLANSNGGG